MKHNHFGRGLALLLAITMLATLLPFDVFAKEYFDGIVYVSFGDSMTNGYGHENYELENGKNVNGFRQNDVTTNYPYLLAQYLKMLTGKEVKEEQLAVSCMRAEDINFLLRFHTDDAAWVAEAEKLQNTGADVDAWKTTIEDEWNSIFVDNGKVIGDYFTWDEFVNGRFRDWGDVDPTWKANGTVSYAEYYQKAVKNADVISLGVGNSNFGVIMLRNLVGALGINFGNIAYRDGVSVWDLIDQRVDPEFVPYVREAVMFVNAQAYKWGTEAGLTPELIQKLTTTLEYTVASLLVNYIDMLYAIDDLNDKEKLDVIMLSFMNTMSGIKVDLGDGTIIDLGGILDIALDAMNSFIFTLPVILQEAKGDFENINFYIVPFDEKIEMLNADMADKTKVAENEVLRKRMIRDITGNVFALLKSSIDDSKLKLDGVNNYVLPTSVDVDKVKIDVEAYAKMRDAYFAWVSGGRKDEFTLPFLGTSENELTDMNDAMTAALYMAIENAVSENADNDVLDANGLLSLMGGFDAIFGSIAQSMNFDESALEALEASVKSSVAAYMKSTLIARGEARELTAQLKTKIDDITAAIDKAVLAIEGDDLTKAKLQTAESLYLTVKNDPTGLGLAPSGQDWYNFNVEDEANFVNNILTAGAKLTEFIGKININNNESMISQATVMFKAIETISALENGLEAGLENNEAVGTLLALFARMIIGDGIGSHPNVAGHATIEKAIEKYYPYAPAKLVLIEKAKYLGDWAYAYARENGIITDETEKAFFDALDIIRTLEGMSEEEIKAAAEGYLLAAAEKYGTMAFEKFNEFIVANTVLDERQLAELEAKVIAVIEAYQVDPEATVKATVNELVDFVFEVTGIDKADFAAKVNAIVDAYKYITSMSKEELADEIAKIIMGYIDQFKDVDVIELIENYLIANGYVTINEIEFVEKQIMYAIAAYEAKDNEAVETSIKYLALAAVYFADINGLIPQELKDAVVKAAELYNTYKDVTVDDIKMMAIAQIKKYVAEYKAEALIAIQTYLVNEGWYAKAEQAKELSDKIAAVIAAYKADPEGTADKLIVELVNFLYNKGVENGYIDPAKVAELQKFADIAKDAYTYFVTTPDAQIKADAVELVYSLYNEYLAGYVDEELLEYFRIDVEKLLYLIANNDQEALKAELDAFVQEVEATYQLLAYFATHGSYVPNKESYYVALGGDTVYGAGLGRADKSYMDLLKERLCIDGEAIGAELLEMTDIYDYILANAETIKKADLITYQTDASAFLFAAISENDPDWSKYLTKEELEFIGAALPIVENILLDDWTKYAEIDVDAIVYTIRDQVIAELKETITSDFFAHTDKLDAMIAAIITEVKAFIEEQQEEAMIEFLTDLIKTAFVVETLYEDVTEIINADYASYVDLHVDEIVDKIMSIIPLAEAYQYMSEQAVKNVLEGIINKVLGIEAAVEADAAALGEYFEAIELEFANEAYALIQKYIIANWNKFNNIPFEQIKADIMNNVIGGLIAANKYVALPNYRIVKIADKVIDTVIDAVTKAQFAVKEEVENMCAFAGIKLDFAKAAYADVLSYMYANWAEFKNESILSVHEKVKAEIERIAYEEHNYDYQRYIIGCADAVDEVLTYCENTAKNAIIAAQAKATDFVDNKIYVPLMEVLLEAFTEIFDVISYDYTVFVDLAADEISKAIKPYLFAALEKQSDAVKAIIYAEADNLDVVLTALVEEIQNVLKIVENNKDNFIAAIAELKPLDPYMEKLVYGAVAYAVDTVKAIETIEAINPEATIIVVGMYNQLNGLNVKLNDKTVDLGNFMAKVVEATDTYYTCLAIADGGFMFVPVPETEINGFTSVVDLDKMDINSLGGMLLRLRSSMNANAAGHEYIYEEIMGRLEFIPVTGVELDIDEITKAVGDEAFTLTATISPEAALNRNITWSSDNEDVATVDENGEVTIVGAGIATITVTTEDGEYTDECTVYVTPAVDNKTVDSKQTSYATTTFEAENGELKLIVECDNGCVVAAVTNGEAERLTGKKIDENKYEYDITDLDATASIFVALKGDYDFDGTVDMNDATNVMYAWVNDSTITDLKALVIDVDNDDAVDMNDATAIMYAWVNGETLPWDAEEDN